jgi:hypothetical protein
MTTNQLIALSFPVATTALVGLTALFVRWYWGRPREDRPATTEIAIDRKTVDEARELIRRAERTLQPHH